MPNTETKPRATMSDGTHNGTAESERIKRFPGKLLFAVKKAAVLFVKNTNVPALSLYRALGFKKRNGYIIAYFR